MTQTQPAIKYSDWFKTPSEFLKVTDADWLKQEARRVYYIRQDGDERALGHLYRGIIYGDKLGEWYTPDTNNPICKLDEVFLIRGLHSMDF